MPSFYIFAVFSRTKPQLQVMHLSMLSRGKGGRGGRGGGGVDKAFMPEGVAFDFMDSPQGEDM